MLAFDLGKKHTAIAFYKDGEMKTDLISLVPGKKPKLMDDVCLLWSILDQLNEKYKIETIIVEKQVMCNTKCMQYQAVIRVWSLQHHYAFISYDPKNKFKYTHESYNSLKKEHKKIAIRYAVSILNYLHMPLELIDNFKKKDDVSDSICMAFMSYHDDKTVRSVLLSRACTTSS